MSISVNEPGSEIILVHGLWFGAWSLAQMARRLKRSGMPVYRFGYRSTRGCLDEHAEMLYRFARRNRCEQRHFVGHSLGGLVVLRMLMAHGDIEPGRVVFLGSPLKGSHVAKKAGRLPGAMSLLGSMHETLKQGYEEFPGNREMGMIAGNRPIGLGWLVGGMGGPGDGTVALDETRAGWLKEHRVLPVTHTGMIFSPGVAELAARFLQTGTFDSAGA